MRSAKLNNIDVEVFGLHQEWLGGDMANGPGGNFLIDFYILLLSFIFFFRHFLKFALLSRGDVTKKPEPRKSII